MALTRYVRSLKWLLAPGVLLGIILGVIGWGGFNTVMEATNSLEFCISCHDMRANIYPDYTKSVHYRNASGVRAICSDCHVPKDWTHKVVRKIHATKELFHAVVGSIDTPEKFEARRLDLARHEWSRMRNSDSRECRNCHSFDAMDFHKQRAKSAAIMEKAAAGGWTCIDCHKGIAHKMPDTTARYKAMERTIAGSVFEPAVGSLARCFKPAPFYLDLPAAEASKPSGEIFPLASLLILERKNDWIRVELKGWQRNGYEEQIVFGKGVRLLLATLDEDALKSIETRDPLDDDNEWREVRLMVWTKKEHFTQDDKALQAYGAEIHEASCSMCHALHPPDQFSPNEWIGKMNAMKRLVPLREDEYALLLAYVQGLSARTRSRAPGEDN
jgi:trimethylamine-N-oxide reductase cytochrome c-type subunit TorC